MIQEMLDRMKTGAQIRLAIGFAVLVCVMAYFGAKETWRCVRSVFPAATVSYAEATAKGLVGYGYVKVTGAAPRVKDAVAAVSRKLGEVRAVYVPVDGTAGEKAGGPHRVLVWMSAADSKEAALELEGASEVVGFVDTNVEFHGGSLNEQTLRTVGGGRAAEIWVVEVRRPSWLKAIGLGGGAIAIVVGLVAYLMVRPLEP